MIKKLTAIFLLCFLSSCSNVFDSVKMNEKRNDPTYKVAVLLPLSGKNEIVGKTLLNAINLAYNQNPNRYIVLKIYDTKGDVKQSEKIAKQVLADGNKAVLGPLFGEEAVIIANKLAKNDIPVFTFSNDLTLVQNTPNLYTLSPLPSVEIEATIDYASKNLRSKKFAVLVPNNKYGEIMYASIQKYIEDRNLTLVRYVTYDPNSSRITPFLRRLIPTNQLIKYEKINASIRNKEEVLDAKGNPITKAPDVILDFDTLILADFGARASVVTSHLPSLGVDLDSIKILGLSNLETPETYTNKFFKNTYFASLVDYSETPFSIKYEEYYGTPVRLLEIAAYDSVITLLSLVYKDTEGNLVNNFTNEYITETNLRGSAGNFIITKNKIAKRNMTIKQITKRSTIDIKKENMNLDTFVINADEKIEVEPLYYLPKDQEAAQEKRKEKQKEKEAEKQKEKERLEQEEIANKVSAEENTFSIEEDTTAKETE